MRFTETFALELQLFILSVRIGTEDLADGSLLVPKINTFNRLHLKSDEPY